MPIAGPDLSSCSACIPAPVWICVPGRCFADGTRPQLMLIFHFFTERCVCVASAAESLFSRAASCRCLMLPPAPCSAPASAIDRTTEAGVSWPAADPRGTTLLVTQHIVLVSSACVVERSKGTRFLIHLAIQPFGIFDLFLDVIFDLFYHTTATILYQPGIPKPKAVSLLLSWCVASQKTCPTPFPWKLAS